ncbi:TIGR04222 domain-containing membrane protein [Streptomyces sannanensis]|uniref:TIGR04222 domain-containing membrane protein n=1 Tax=Streptomyces sannanensis TaxID=285536 RepID=A0ABP6SHU1_9ACTN
MLWVLFLLLACAIALLSCGRLCLAAVEAARPLPESASADSLSLYEAAFLSGGPYRVTDLTLVSMHRARRLLLAHTGWATVVDPEGQDELERSVIGAIGPSGQSRTAAIRSATAAADAVRALADRLTAAGLAVPEPVRSGVDSAIRTVWAAALLVVALGAGALLMPGHGPDDRGLVAAWFGLPLVLVVGCLIIARIEVYAYTRWASPAGQRLLRALSPSSGSLTAVAVHGVAAVEDPALRTALTGGRPVHRGD